MTIILAATGCIYSNRFGPIVKKIQIHEKLMYLPTSFQGICLIRNTLRERVFWKKWLYFETFYQPSFKVGSRGGDKPFSVFESSKKGPVPPQVCSSKRVRTEANVSTGLHPEFSTVAFQNFRELTLIVHLTALTVSEPLLQLVVPVGWKIADVTEIADVIGIVTSAILVAHT